MVQRLRRIKKTIIFEKIITGKLKKIIMKTTKRISDYDGI